jgi:hypothetical protein
LIATNSSPAIAGRHLASVHSGGGVITQFEITNGTAHTIYVHPISIEAREDTVWTRCFEFPASTPSIVDAFSRWSPTFETRNLPNGVPLRVRLGVSRESRELHNLYRRLELRLHGITGVSLNPFDRTHRVVGRSTELFSEEFVESPVAK